MTVISLLLQNYGNPYHKYQANIVVVERNHGGAMAAQTLATQDATVAVREVWASPREVCPGGARQRALRKGAGASWGMFAALEDELCNWVPGEGLPSPNRLDAVVWSLTELLLQGEAPLPAVDLSKALQGMTKAAPFGGRMSGPRPRLPGRIWAEDLDNDY